MSNPIAAVILAAGKGTRMKSDLHKVLHPIAGRPMLLHLMASVDALNPAKKVVVVGDKAEQLETALAGSADLAVQEPQRGTGHAVQQAEGALAGFDGDVLLLYGDVPFVPTATMQAMIDRLNAPDAPAVVVLAFEPADPQQYGRVITDGDRVTKMVEHKDATDAERAVRLCNSGLMAAKSADLFALLARVTDDNAAGEFYLVDIVNIANADGRHSAVVITDPYDVAGINSRGELAAMEGEWQARRRVAAMADGASLISPETVWFAWDTQLGRDVLIEPNVMFESDVRVGDRSRIEAHLVIPQGSHFPPDSIVGPGNLYAFQRSAAPSSGWTGRYAVSERARLVLSLGPTAVASLSGVIRDLESRLHNQPPEIADTGDFAEILPALKELRQRLNELIHAIERGGREDGLPELTSFYRARVRPWLHDRVVEAGDGINGLISAAPASVLAYAAMSQMAGDGEFATLLSSGAAALVAARAAGREKMSNNPETTKG